MSRADNRAFKSDKRRFIRQIAGHPLDTALIEVGTSLVGHRHARVFADATGDACRSASGMKCMACAQTFTNMRPMAAVLLACSSVRPSFASSSGICLACWRPDDLSEIEIAATRVLRKVIPNGEFEPLPVHDTS
ncbi:MAG: hypothetical protein C0480_10130 [Bradyrhizobium sp.]|nr:hypothetical protein [Bradyrhizobium sp.]